MDMETEILSIVTDKGKIATTTAVVRVKAALDFEGTAKVVQRTCKVHVRTKLDAPHFRIKRRVHAQAKSATLAYFDGQDMEESNIFAGSDDETKTSGLSKQDELALERELADIEDEFKLAA
jgi:hypothetical protein